MTPERWQRIEELVEAARERDPTSGVGSWMKNVTTTIYGLSLLDELNHTKPATRLFQALALTRLGRIDEAKSSIEEIYERGWKAPEFKELCPEHGLVDAETPEQSGEPSPSPMTPKS